MTFDARMDKLHDEIASVKDVAISHNQAIHQLFKLNEQTQQKFDRLHEQTIQKFDRLHEQRKDEFELNQQNFEILNEQRERDMEETRKKAELADQQREKDVRALYDLIKQVTRKIDSITDAMTKPDQNGRQ